MTSTEPASNDEQLNDLWSRDIAALYLGYRELLTGLQEQQGAGKRIAGGY